MSPPPNTVEIRVDPACLARFKAAYERLEQMGPPPASIVSQSVRRALQQGLPAAYMTGLSYVALKRYYRSRWR